MKLNSILFVAAMTLVTPTFASKIAIMDALEIETDLFNRLKPSCDLAAKVMATDNGSRDHKILDSLMGTMASDLDAIVTQMFKEGVAWPKSKPRLLYGSIIQAIANTKQ